MTNQFFDTQRFRKFFRSELFSNWRHLLMAYGVIVGAVLGLTLYISWYQYRDMPSGWSFADPMQLPEFILFTIAMMIGACISGAAVFSPLKTKQGRIADLTMPASQFEKYLTRWLIMVPCFFIALWLGFMVVDWVRMLWGFIIAKPGHHITSAVPHFFDEGALVWKYITAFFTVQSIFILGASIWPRRAVLITFLVCALIMFCLTIFDTVLVISLADQIGRRSTPGPFDFIETFGYVLAIFFCIVNYIVAYFRYKEMEIIQRW